MLVVLLTTNTFFHNFHVLANFHQCFPNGKKSSTIQSNFMRQNISAIHFWNKWTCWPGFVYIFLESSLKIFIFEISKFFFTDRVTKYEEEWGRWRGKEVKEGKKEILLFSKNKILLQGWSYV